MKNLFFFLFCCISSSAFANNGTFEKLKQVNPCWSEQKDINAALLPSYSGLSEKEWIRTHLSLVESILRNRNTDQLSATQKQNRTHCLELLHGYWQAGNFPVNDDYSTSTPIFIDKHDNFCAVGYLVMATGNEQVSRMIASKTNLAYVREMNYPELNTWAADNGFTVGELAWIQPKYPPATYCSRIGGGVDGSVQELLTDDGEGKLYVGGNFSMVDGAMPAGNVAYVTESGGTYTWNAMAGGVNGQVNAIAKFDNKIFVAGSFTMAGGAPADNIAYWDATGWHSAGCVNGTVYDLVVFGGNLYAAGEFTGCSLVGDNFAKWTGSAWTTIPGTTGRINTMEVKGSSLMLGGAFSYGSVPTNAIWWNETSSFSLPVNTIEPEVMDFEVFEDTLYAVCKRASTTDTAQVFLKLRNGTWISALDGSETIGSFYPLYSAEPIAFNTLCTEAGYLHVGGQFAYAPILGAIGRNCYSVGNTDNWVVTDSAVNKMTFFKGDLIVAGKFKNGNSGGFTTTPVNGIAKRVIPSTATPMVSAADQTSVYPNPVRSGALLTVSSNFNAGHYTVHHLTGRQVATGTISGNATIALPAIPTGMYLVTLSNDAGERVMKKIVVE